MRHDIVHFCRISSAVVALFRYEIMTRCWHDDATTRPSFSDICVSIEQIVDSPSTCHFLTNRSTRLAHLTNHTLPPASHLNRRRPTPTFPSRATKRKRRRTRHRCTRTARLRQIHRRPPWRWLKRLFGARGQQH